MEAVEAVKAMEAMEAMEAGGFCKGTGGEGRIKARGQQPAKFRQNANSSVIAGHVLGMMLHVGAWLL